MAGEFLIERFGGLQLAGDVLETGASGAVDLKNAWINDGRVETCPTVSTFATATRNVRRIYAHPAAQLLASESDGTNVTLEAFDLSGVSVATTTYVSSTAWPHAFASIGTPGTSRTY